MTETATRDETIDTGERQPRVSVHKCSCERTVFTEQGNNDGWIATDHTVSLRR